MSVKGLYYISSLFLIFRTGGSFNCDEECYGAYQSGTVVNSCAIVEEALACASEHDCRSSLSFILANNDIQRLGCVSQSSLTTNDELPTATTVDTVTQPPNCPTLPTVVDDDLALILPKSSVDPPSALPSACVAPASLDKKYRQCSLFMDSQLRAFSDYRQGLETCSIPGKWHLLQHQSLTIEVEGTNLSNHSFGEAHTRLSKINVTISPSSCDPVSRSYVAQGSLPLSSQFSPPIVESNDSLWSSQALQLVCDSNGTVVTLLVSWLNTAIVIRQYAGFLSVTIQVPGQIVLESHGLCMGCPSQRYINITRFNDQILSSCNDAKSKAMYGCFQGGGVVNQQHLSNITNNTYLDACLYNMYKTRTVDVLTMIHAISEDAKPITTLMSSPSSTSSSQTASNPAPSSSSSSQTATNLDSFISHAVATHTYPKLLAVLGCLLLFLLLR